MGEPHGRPWTDADRELVARAWRSVPVDLQGGHERAAAVLDALTAAGWHQDNRWHVCLPTDVEAT